MAGVLVHSYDGREEPGSPWKPCTGEKAFCYALSHGLLDRIAASVGLCGLAAPTLAFPHAHAHAHGHVAEKLTLCLQFLLATVRTRKTGTCASITLRKAGSS